MENSTNYGYYSKLLQKPFDTLEELKKEEKLFNEKNLAEQKAKAEKKADAQEVADAYAEYLKVSREANQKILDAKTNWIEKRDAFVKKYDSYHMTYTNVDGKEDINVNSLFGDIFDDLFHNFNIKNWLK